MSVFLRNVNANSFCLMIQKLINIGFPFECYDICYLETYQVTFLRQLRLLVSLY